MNSPTGRKMIRLDEEEEEQTGQVDVELPEQQQVVIRKVDISEKVTSGGVSWQRCGGGRRRLPHKGGSY